MLGANSLFTGSRWTRERLPAFQPSAHPSTHLLSQTCKQQPLTGPVLAEGVTLFSEPRFSQLGSCWDNCAGKACLPETKPFPAAARELIRSIITLHSPFSNQLIATAVNSLSQGQLAGTRGCNDCALACPLWLSSFKRFFFLNRNASSTVKLYATLLSISKMAGPLSAAATAHWVPLAFRSHSNSQQTDLASMADHVQRTTQLVNFFFIKFVIFRTGAASVTFLNVSSRAQEPWSLPWTLPPPHTHALSFSGGTFVYISLTLWDGGRKAVFASIQVNNMHIAGEDTNWNRGQKQVWPWSHRRG